MGVVSQTSLSAFCRSPSSTPEDENLVGEGVVFLVWPHHISPSHTEKIVFCAAPQLPISYDHARRYLESDSGLV